LDFPCLDFAKVVWLERLFQEEVLRALLSMGGDKAPGLDGFAIAFFWFCWAIVRNDIMCVFHNFHEHEIFKKSLDANFIALFPKKIGQLEVKDFKPISLMGTVYKIMAKVLATRMK